MLRIPSKDKRALLESFEMELNGKHKELEQDNGKDLNKTNSLAIMIIKDIQRRENGVKDLKPTNSGLNPNGNSINLVKVQSCLRQLIRADNLHECSANVFTNLMGKEAISFYNFELLSISISSSKSLGKK